MTRDTSRTRCSRRDERAGPAIRPHGVKDHLPPRGLLAEPGHREARRAPATVALAVEISAVVLGTLAATAGALLQGLSVGPVWAVVAFGLLVTTARARDSRHSALQLSLLDDLARILRSTAIAAAVVVAGRALVVPEPSMAVESFRLWLFVTVYVGVARMAIVAQVRRSRQAGRYSAVNTLIVGAGTVGHQIAARLHALPALGMNPVGLLDDDPLTETDTDHSVPVLGPITELDRMVWTHGVGHVVLAFSRSSHAELLGVLRRCRELGVTVSLVPRLYEEVNQRVAVRHLGGIPLLQVHHVDPKGWQFAAKYALDRVVAGSALALLAPLMLALAATIRLTSPGPALFRCRRVGLDGREFDMLKFRTMTGSPETHGSLNDRWAAEVLGEDERCPTVDRRTPLGRWLRKLSLDELPQLINVVRGEMSLIGPRPERVPLANRFGQRLYRYRDRHRVKSGMTGWAQVHGLRGDTNLSDRVEWDNYYIENWSPWLDLKIAVLTVPSVLSGRNAE